MATLIEGRGEIWAWQADAVRFDFADHWTPAVPCGFIVVGGDLDLVWCRPCRVTGWSNWSGMQAGAGGDDGKAGGFEELKYYMLRVSLDLVGKETAGLAGLAYLGLK